MHNTSERDIYSPLALGWRVQHQVGATYCCKHLTQTFLLVWTFLQPLNNIHSFLNTIHNNDVKGKQQVSNKSVFIGQLSLDPWIINTPDRERKEKSMSLHK